MEYDIIQICSSIAESYRYNGVAKSTASYRKKSPPRLVLSDRHTKCRKHPEGPVHFLVRVGYSLVATIKRRKRINISTFPWTIRELKGNDEANESLDKIFGLGRLALELKTAPNPISDTKISCLRPSLHPPTLFLPTLLVAFQYLKRATCA